MPSHSQIQIILGAMAAFDKLTDMENEFIDSLAKYENDYVLSDHESTLLNRISKKVNR